MSYLDELKKQSENSIEARKKEFEKPTKETFGKENFLKLSLDKKTKSAEVVLRFLPCKEGETNSKQFRFIHAFKNPQNNKTFYAPCPTTLKKDSCPVCDYNTEHYATDPKNDRFRKKKYYTNVYVVSTNVEELKDQVGKVLVWEFGPQMYEKLESGLKPKTSRKKAVDPFSLFGNGAYFYLNITLGENEQWDYSESGFGEPEAFDKSEKELEEILNSLHSLEEFVDSKNFDSYDDLQKYFNRVMSIGEVTKPNSSSEESYEKPVRTSKAVKELENDLPEINLDELPF